MNLYKAILNFIKSNGIEDISNMFVFMLNEVKKSRIKNIINIIFIVTITIVYSNYYSNFDVTYNIIFMFIITISLLVNIYRILVLSTYLDMIENYMYDYVKVSNSTLLTIEDKEIKIAYIVKTLFKNISIKANVNSFFLFKMVRTENATELKHIF